VESFEEEPAALVASRLTSVRRHSYMWLHLGLPVPRQRARTEHPLLRFDYS